MSEKQKTNFEAWRDQLTPEEVATKLDASNLVCDFCPSRSVCNGTYCKDHFTRWANTPAKEEE